MSTATYDRTFSQLQVSNWRQFGNVDIQFHPRLTVVTGANAAGKTTLLNLLGHHFNWAAQYLAVPFRTQSGVVSWRIQPEVDEPGGVHFIGQLVYSDGSTSPIQIGFGNSPTYGVGFPQQQFVAGVYFASHRPLSPYQTLQAIPTQFSSTQALLDQYRSELFSRYMSTGSSRSPLLQMKEALLAAAIYGEGNSSVEPNPEAYAIWKGFQTVLSKLLPPSLGFIELKVRSPDLLIRTLNSEFMIDAVSGGMSSVIDMAWQIFLRSRERPAFTVCIDEPENHLHPSLQRSIIPGLLEAFPELTFIVATHSPFIVTAVSESSVYVLDYEEEKVFSRLLDTISKSASSDETLRRVLGLETTMPLWVERRLDEILSDFPTGSVGPDDLRRLRDQMTSMGLQREFPAAVTALFAEEPSAPPI